MIRIVSDGTTNGTRVETEFGVPIKGVSRIEIEPLSADYPGAVRAHLTFDLVMLHVDVREGTTNLPGLPVIDG